MTVTNQTSYQSDTRANIEALSPAKGTIACCTDTHELGVYSDTGWVFTHRNRSVGLTSTTLDGVQMPSPYYNLDFSDVNTSILNDSGVAASDGDSVSKVTSSNSNVIGEQTNAIYQPKFVTETSSIRDDIGTNNDSSVIVNPNSKRGLYFPDASQMNFRTTPTSSRGYTSIYVYTLPGVYHNRRVGTNSQRSNGPTSSYNTVYFERYNNYEHAGFMGALEYYHDTNSMYFYNERDDYISDWDNQRHDRDNSISSCEPLDWDQVMLNKTYIAISRQKDAESTESAYYTPWDYQFITNKPNNWKNLKPASVVRHNSSYFECEKSHIASTTPPATSQPEWKEYIPNSNDNLVNDAQRVISDWVTGRRYFGPPSERLTSDVSGVIGYTYSNSGTDDYGPNTYERLDEHKTYNAISHARGRRGFSGWASGWYSANANAPHVLHQRVEFSQHISDDQLNEYIHALRVKWGLSYMDEGTNLTKQFINIP